MASGFYRNSSQDQSYTEAKQWLQTKEEMNLYERTCKEFTKSSVEFVIVGGFAVNFWGYNRSTGDLDFLVNPKGSNLEKLFDSLNHLGFSMDEEAKAAILKNELIQFSDEYHVVELLFKINLSKTFEEIYNNAKKSTFGEVLVSFIDFDDLIMEKIKSKRQKDLNDVYELKRIHNLD